MLELNGITKDFSPPLSLRRIAALDFKPAAVRALDNVSFTLPRGLILAVLGPNGAGKTTLLKILSTLVLPDKGTLRVDGWSLDRDEEKIKERVGLVSASERSFYWRLTGRQNLEFFAAMYGLDPRRANTRIKELLGLFRVDYQDKRFDGYSTGMQQKLGLIRAMLHDPALLLLDEPTRSLDYTAARELRHFIRRHLVEEKKKTVVFTTHQLDETEGFADRYLILHKGRVYAFGTLEELRRQAKAPEAGLGKIFVQLISGDRDDA